MAKDILIISNYYPPESGAAANRIHTLAKSLSKNKYQVTVICPLPNYPFGKIFKTHKGSFIKKTIENQITVYRLWLFASNSKNKFIRLTSMLSFSLNLFFFLLFKKTPKKVIIQCSPLFVGFFSVLAGVLKRKTIILNVSDLWPLAGLEMGILNKGIYYRILEKTESFNYKYSDLILGQSQEILSYIDKKFANKKLFLYQNFPDFEISTTVKEKNTLKIKIVYAGLLGIAQGVHNICKELQLPENVEFHIYGNGPETEMIKEISEQKTNVFYHGSVSRSVLHQELKKYHITLIPLINRIYGSVPSKIFEYTRVGIPILYFSDGEGSDIVKKHQLGFTIKSLDYRSLNNFVIKLSNQEVTLPLPSQLIKVSEVKFNLSNQFMDLLKVL